MIFSAIVTVSCSCGLFPLDKSAHRTSMGAWNAAASHVALNPTECQPSMRRDTVAAGLAAVMPA